MRNPPILFSIFCLLLSFQSKLSAQIKIGTLDLNKEAQTTKGKLSLNYSVTNQVESIIWSEDFANGIPSTWLNQGSPSGDSSVWLYHGPGPGAIQPADSGSQGLYSLPADPIQSNTRSNGFAIYDSDYYETGGWVIFGYYLFPTPHYGTLTTPVIDLSSEQNVDLAFTQYYRRFAGPGGNQQVPATYIDISLDGGQTFPHSLTVNDDIEVNSATAANARAVLNISQYVGGESDVRIRFRFDGDFYFWMIDDISLQRTPNYRMEFSTTSSRPEIEFYSGPSLESSKMPVFTSEQSRDLYWSCLAINTGALPLYNARLNMILDYGSFVDTIQGQPYTGVFGGIGMADTIGHSDINTFGIPYQPNASWSQSVDFVYYVTADSNASGGQVIELLSDTFQFHISDSILSLDAFRSYNSIGTPQLGDDGSAIAVRYDLTGNSILEYVWVGLHQHSQPGGMIALSIYDSSAFIDDVLGFDTNIRLAYVQKNVTATDISNQHIRLEPDPLNGGIFLLDQNMGAYYFVVELYSFAGTGIIRIPNDQLWKQSKGVTLRYAPGDKWYDGYYGGRGFNSPRIRLLVSPPFSLEEKSLKARIYPNPAAESIKIETEAFRGPFNYSISQITGQELISGQGVLEGSIFNLDISPLSSGIYILHIEAGNHRSSMRLVIN